MPRFDFKQGFAFPSAKGSAVPFLICHLQKCYLQKCLHLSPSKIVTLNFFLTHYSSFVTFKNWPLCFSSCRVFPHLSPYGLWLLDRFYQLPPPWPFPEYRILHDTIQKHISRYNIIQCIMRYNIIQNISQYKTHHSTKHSNIQNTVDRSYRRLFSFPTVGLNHHCLKTHMATPLLDIVVHFMQAINKLQNN